MESPQVSRERRESPRRWAVAALGVAFAGAAVAHFLLYQVGDATVAFVTVSPSLSLLAFGAWFGVRNAAPGGELPVATWTVGGAGLVLALDLGAIAVGAYGATPHVDHVVIQHTSLGALAGALAGTYSERDRQRARSQDRLRRALEAAMDGVAVIDDGGRVTYANDAYSQYYGGDRGDLVGEHWGTAYPPDSRNRIAAVADSLDEADHWRGTVIAWRAGGQTYPQELSMTALDDGGAVWVCRDVTGREERDERLTVLNRVLRHNVRNALNVVLGRVDRIAERHGESEDVASVREAANGLLSVSETAREMERALASDDPHRDDVGDLVAAEVERAREEYPGVSFDVTVKTEAATDDRVKLAVRELLANAAEHNDADDPRVSVAVETRESVVVDIADNGTGLPENEQRALAGERETPVQHGTGVGLWLVYWLVRQCGGSVEGGDSVTVRLPRERTKSGA